MTDDLYERYKEALKVGHVAVLRGALEEALTSYRAAADIAPSRALPHTSLGTALLRLGHVEEALVEYAAAVARAPHDEGALLGQAEALATAGQKTEAARVLEHVSEIQEAAGRLPEAADTLRRALELEESHERTRRQRGLRLETRLSAGDQAAEQLLAKALRIRDEPAMPAPDSTRPAAPTHPAIRPGFPIIAASGPILAPAVAEGSWRVEDPIRTGPVEPESAAEAEPEAAPAPAPESVPVAAEQPEPVAVSEAPSEEGTGVSDEIAAAVVAVMEQPFDAAALPGPVGESEHQPTGDELLAAAEAADLAGDEKALRSLLLWTSRAYAREGKFDAELDVTHRLLQRAPGDVDAHLVLVELYVARNWNALAAEKLALLGRLADLNDDEATRQRICVVASRAFPKDERLESLCS
jgi:tetratricopeptide (TPR) repeat protein